MAKSMTWFQLLKLCKKHGRLKVLEILKLQNQQLENAQAQIWADGGTCPPGLNAQIAKQLETITILSFMTDQDVLDKLGGRKR